jgi:hypothetical protein
MQQSALKERPLMRLKFAKVSRPYVLLWRGELVAVYPISQRENRWTILLQLVRLRDLLWAQEPERN